MLDARITKKLGTRNGHSLTIDVHVRVSDGTTVLFGSSGAGKTSVLRMIAGITTPDEGRILLGETVFFDSAAGIQLPMQKRRVGYVFQNHVLFPHWTARQNVAYGARPLPGQSVQDRVQELFSLIGIQNTAEHYPHELSGGEQQRVALARALATDPLIMLLDEPLSSVDAATRSRLVEEIAAIQTRTKIPFLYVTHNYTEAVRLGKSMVVLDEGKIIQEGPPLEIFNAPRTTHAARLVNAENIFLGTVQRHHPEDGLTSIAVGSCLIEAPYNGLPVGNPVTFGIRSEDIIVSREHITQTSARNVLEGTVTHILLDPDKAELIVFCGIDFRVSVTPATVRILQLEIGAPVYLLIKARALHLLA